MVKTLPFQGSNTSSTLVRVTIFYWPGSSVGLECQPVTLEVVSSSLIQVANADVAQLAEQLICNQQVSGSSPDISSIFFDPLAQAVEHLTFNQGVRSSSLRWVTI